MTKLSTKLPKEYDDNGLESNTRHLLEIYPSQEYMPVVGMIRTKEVLSDEDFTRVPKVEFVCVELAVDSEDQGAARDLLKKLHDSRVKHIKQPLDLPDVDEPTIDDPLELEEAGDVIDAEVVEDDELVTTGKEA